jgi:putative phosphoribosyl transferase
MGAPLDVIVVRKLGVPSQPELGMGAIGEDGVCVLNPDVIRYLSITERALHRVTEAERAELERRSARYRRDAPMIPLEGRTVVVIDDGLATGSTARAAIEVARAHGARRVALAVPVAPRETVVELGEVADDVICVASPEPFTSIGQWYRDFRQTTDAEVSELLLRARQPRDTGGSP